MNSNELEPYTKDTATWFPFEKQTVTEAPREDGVYILRQAGGKLFGRLRGSSDILYIGSTTCKGGLRQRLSQYFHPGPTQWTNLRISSYFGKYQMEVAWFPTNNALNREHELLTRYIEDLQCIRAIEAIKTELSPYGFKDFIDVDVYFWFIYENIISTEEQKPEKPVPKAVSISINSHEGAEYYLLEMGKMLGFNPYTVDQSKVFENKTLGDVAILTKIPPFAGERDINTVREIDVIWFGDDENPKMCFEVEHTTDIVHGLDRLIQLQHIYAKFFIVAPEEKRAKFQDLVTNRYPYRKFCSRFKFISYDELAQLYEVTLPFHNMKKELFGE